MTITFSHAGEFSEQNTFKAGKIESSATMLDHSNITYQAGTEISLVPGFTVELGAQFSAEIVPCPSGTTWVYQYAITDHLGNNRLLFADLNDNGSVEASEILQENHYYPFGMEMKGEWSEGANAGEPENRYRYNGKEFSEELGLYDYGARYYDPSIGRWNAVDPKAEHYGNLSPYNYVANNPINAIDPNGEYIIFIGGSPEDREYFLNQFQNLFGGNVSASFSSGGESRLIFEQTGDLSDSQQAAFDIINGYASDEENEFTVRFSNNDDNIPFESYDTREFDPSDFEAYPAGDNQTRGALAHYTHFFAEQYERQVVQGITGLIRQGQGEDPSVASKEFLQSHEYALEQEARVSGVVTRDTDLKSFPGGISNITFTNYDRNGNALSTYQLWFGGKGVRVSPTTPVKN